MKSGWNEEKKTTWQFDNIIRDWNDKIQDVTDMTRMEWPETIIWQTIGMTI